MAVGVEAAWRADGTWERLLRAVQAGADATGVLDWVSSVDSTNTRAHQDAAGAVPPRAALLRYGPAGPAVARGLPSLGRRRHGAQSRAGSLSVTQLPADHPRGGCLSVIAKVCSPFLASGASR